MNSSASCCLLVLKSDLNLAKSCFKGSVDCKDEWSVFVKFLKFFEYHLFPGRNPSDFQKVPENHFIPNFNIVFY